MSPSTTRNTELPKTALLFTLPVKAVSYTHLRAHETF